jgi:hypothetical protein
MKKKTLIVFPVVTVLMFLLAASEIVAFHIDDDKEAKSDKKEIKLEYKPTSLIKNGPATTGNLKIFIGDLKSDDSGNEVGKNSENEKKSVSIISTETNGPSYLVNKAFNKEFKGIGFTVVSEKAQADRIISGTIIKFWCEETSLYQAVVRIKVEIKDKNGKVIFSKIYAETAKRFGRSLSEENYNESFSEAVRHMIETMFVDNEFIKSLT